MKNRCKFCGHEWNSRDPEKKPRACPKCKRYGWEKDLEEKEE